MDVVSAVSGYISKMVSTGDGTTSSSSSKMKILLLDSETVRVLAKQSPSESTLTLPGRHRFYGHNSISLAEP